MPLQCPLSSFIAKGGASLVPMTSSPPLAEGGVWLREGVADRRPNPAGSSASHSVRMQRRKDIVFVWKKFNFKRRPIDPDMAMLRKHRQPANAADLRK